MWPKWLRGLVTLWVAFDSKNRKGLDFFWVLVVFILGPLLAPFYIAARPLLKGETRRGSIIWNAMWNFEKLFSTIIGIATMAAFFQNMQESKNEELPEVKRAEIKAGTILGLLAILLFFAVERLGIDSVRNWLEADLPEEKAS